MTSARSKVLYKYNHSPKGIAARARFKKTKKYANIQERWRVSEAGKLSNLKAQNKYLSNPIKKMKKSKRHTEYCKEQYQSNVFYKLSIFIRNSLNRSIKNKRINKNNKSFQYIGCSLEKLKYHIESQFLEGMTWDNHGDWHIDHISPLASAKTEEDIFKLNHYTNLQPLWEKENLQKSSKQQ